MTARNTAKNATDKSGADKADTIITPVLDSKSLKIVKKARKLMRKLRKRALKNKDNETFAGAVSLIEIYDLILTKHKAGSKLVPKKDKK